MKKYLIPSLLAAFASVVSAQTITFDASTDYSNNFSPAGGQSGSYNWNSGNGVGGVSGFMDVGGSGSDPQVYYNTGLTKNTTDIFSVSYLIKIGTPTNDLNDFRVGFIRSTGSNFSGGGDSINAYFRSDGGVSTYTMELRSSNTSVTETSQFSVTADRWYELRFDMSLDSDTQVDVTTGLYDRGANGTSTATIVAGSSITQDNVAMTGGGFNGTDFFAALSTRNNTGSVAQGWDNFSAVAVPEPSAYALIAGFLALGSIMVRRRRA